MLVVVDKDQASRKILDEYMLFYDDVKSEISINSVGARISGDDIPSDYEVIAQALQDNYEHPVYPLEYCHIYMLEKVFDKLEQLKERDLSEFNPGYKEAIIKVLEGKEKIRKIFGSLINKATFIFSGKKSLIAVFNVNDLVLLVYPVLFYSLILDQNKLEKESENLNDFTGKILFKEGGQYQFISFRTYDNSFGARTTARNFESNKLKINNQELEDAVITGFSEKAVQDFREIINNMSISTAEESLADNAEVLNAIGGNESFINLAPSNVGIAYFKVS